MFLPFCEGGVTEMMGVETLGGGGPTGVSVDLLVCGLWTEETAANESQRLQRAGC